MVCRDLEGLLPFNDVKSPDIFRLLFCNNRAIGSVVTLNSLSFNIFTFYLPILLVIVLYYDLPVVSYNRLFTGRMAFVL